MKNPLLLIPAALFAVTAFLPAQEGKPAAAAPAAQLDPAVLIDRVSYFIGTDVARNFQEQSLDIKVESFIEGLKTTLEKGKSKYTEQELGTAMNQFSQMMIAKQKKEADQAGEANKAEGEKFIATNGKREGVTTTKSGLQYEVLKKGTGKLRPRLTWSPCTITARS